MVSQLTTPISEIIYPESDGAPIANNTIHSKWRVAIKQNLDRLFANNPDVFIAGDLFWYPVEGKSKIVYAPDVMVVLERPKGNRKSYKLSIK